VTDKLVAPSETLFDEEGAILATVGVPAPIRYLTPIFVAPENFTNFVQTTAFAFD
jgi:hypothetical protein